MIKTSIALISALFLLLHGCKDNPEKEVMDIAENTDEHPTLFTLLSKEKTNVDFENTLKEGLNANVLVYEYLYNGGGVATGDFNDDGLQDLYFTSNMGNNKFYLNKGNFKFQDVTNIAKVTGRKGPWKTGVSSVDINGDGRLDFICVIQGRCPKTKERTSFS